MLVQSGYITIELVYSLEISKHVLTITRQIPAHKSVPRGVISSLSSF